MKQAKFLKVKLISIVITILGIIISAVFWIIETKNWQNYWMRAMTYSYVNPFSGKTVYHSGSEIGELSLFQFAFSDDMNSAIWIETVAILLVFVVLAILAYAFYFNEELTVTDSGIIGKAVRGKDINYPFDRISSVKKSFLKGITVKTVGQENVKFRLVNNQSEIVEAISMHIQPNTGKQAPLTSDNTNESSADQLKKYKELLDSGIITQEEFDAKKKQLLGL